MARKLSASRRGTNKYLDLDMNRRGSDVANQMSFDDLAISKNMSNYQVLGNILKYDEFLNMNLSRERIKEIWEKQTGLD